MSNGAWTGPCAGGPNSCTAPSLPKPATAPRRRAVVARPAAELRGVGGGDARGPAPGRVATDLPPALHDRRTLFRALSLAVVLSLPLAPLRRADGAPGDARAATRDTERLLGELCSAGRPPRRGRLRRRECVGSGGVDHLLRRWHIVVEIDSEPHHSSELDRESDARRDDALHAAGFAVLRFPGEKVWEHPGDVMGEVRPAIAGAALREVLAAKRCGDRNASTAGMVGWAAVRGGTLPEGPGAHRRRGTSR